MSKEENGEQGKWQIAYWVLTFMAGTVCLALIGCWWNESIVRACEDEKIVEMLLKSRDERIRDIASIKTDIKEIKTILIYIADKQGSKLP